MTENKGYIDFTNYEKLQDYNREKREIIKAKFKRWLETPVERRDASN